MKDGWGGQSFVRLFLNVFFCLITMFCPVLTSLFYFEDVMSTTNEKLTKLAHDAKKHRAKKSTQFRPQASPTINGLGSYAAIINLDHGDLVPGSDMATRKRHCEGNGGPNVFLDISHGRAFLMPPCFTKNGYFDRFPLTVSAADTRKIEEMDSATHTKRLAEDGAFMVKVLEMENKRLEEDLRAEWAPANDEPEDLKGLKTRVELIEKIEALGLDCFEIGEAGINMLVSQLKVLNPELNSEGIRMAEKIVDGKLIHNSLVEYEEE